jgi:hypothetical protein
MICTDANVLCLANKGCWKSTAEALSGSLLSMHMTNLGCTLSSSPHIVILKGILQLHCVYQSLFMFFTSDAAQPSFDINDQLGATSFKSCHEDWTSEPMFQDFSKWAGKCFDKYSISSTEYADALH